MSDFDIAVVGGGPGGYVAAERAAARGFKTVLVEQDQLGGVCLNTGCIPTKTLVHSAKILQQAKHSSGYGVRVGDVSYDFVSARAWMDSVVKRLRGGVNSQLERHGVTVEKGYAQLQTRGELSVDGHKLSASNIIVATGSRSVRVPIPGAHLPHVMDSSGVLKLNELPKHVLIIGGGYIGIEFASYFHAVGVNVTVVEMQEEILGGIDAEIVHQLKSSLPRVDFILGAKVTKIDPSVVTINSSGGQHKKPADVVLLATGRVPNTEGIGLEEVGVVFNNKGIITDEHMCTNVAGLYAVGDVTGRSLLAHAALRMGEVAVACISESRPSRDQMRFNAVPWVVYTLPEIAGVGLTEAAAHSSGRRVVVSKIPLTTNGRYLAENLAPITSELEDSGNLNPRGLIKVVVDADSHVLLGVQMIGNPASEIIFGAATMIEAELRVEELREIVFPHPTVSESLRDIFWEISLE